MRNYEEWLDKNPWSLQLVDEAINGVETRQRLSKRSTTILYDTLPIYLAYAGDYVDLEPLRVIVSDDGVVAEDEGGRSLRVATRWHNLEGYLDELAARLCAR
jgi:hypothetical protein